ncbi:hypothetical protein KJ359_005629 [Pestalotiopsis sp. 9143b]|nr:hypothetical protein KJ359_005629 [Pestalotiopsis sp. 9143b]
MVERCNYLKPAARAPNATYGAPSLGNVAAMVEGSNASITANFDGSTISLFDFGSFKWGCVVGERTGLDDDPIEVTGMIPGCNLTLTAYIGQSQVAQQTVRYAPTRMSYPDYVTYILMMASATQTSRIRKVETVTFTLTYPAEALGDSQLAGLYLDDFTTYAYSRVEFLDF